MGRFAGKGFQLPDCLMTRPPDARREKGSGRRRNYPVSLIDRPASQVLNAFRSGSLLAVSVNRLGPLRPDQR
eukprot:3454665-Pyramimonas_sp.AAC.1